MCKECVSKLSRAFSFRKQCREADEYLKSEMIKIEDEFEKMEFKIEMLDEYSEEEKINVLDDRDIKEEMNIDVDYVYETEYLEPVVDESTEDNVVEICAENDPSNSCEVIAEYTIEDITLEETDSKENVFDGDILEASEELIMKIADLNQNRTPKVEIIEKRSKKIYKKYPNDNEEWLCDECGKVCRTKDAYNYHIIKVHNPEEFKQRRAKYFGEFECEHCGRKFHNSIMYKRHLNLHDPNNPNVCEVCGKIYADKSTLTNHKLSHLEEKPFKCEVCGKPSDNIKNWENHMRFHTGERPYKVSNFMQISTAHFKQLNKHKYIFFIFYISLP